MSIATPTPAPEQRHKNCRGALLDALLLKARMELGLPAAATNQALEVRGKANAK